MTAFLEQPNGRTISVGSGSSSRSLTNRSTRLRAQVTCIEPRIL